MELPVRALDIGTEKVTLKSKRIDIEHLLRYIVGASLAVSSITAAVMQQNQHPRVIKVNDMVCDAADGCNVLKLPPVIPSIPVKEPSIPGVEPMSAMSEIAHGSITADVSFPQCKLGVPIGVGGLAIIGVNGGKDFTHNPCAKQLASRFQTYEIYANSDYPGRNVLNPYNQTHPLACLASSSSYGSCEAYNYGYAAGEMSVQYASAQGLKSNNWWLDVETSNSWDGTPSENNNSIIGEINGINETIRSEYSQVPSIGIYSTAYQYRLITGGQPNPVAEWYATGEDSLPVAKEDCAMSFAGGKTIASQIVNNPIGVDLDYNC